MNADYTAKISNVSKELTAKERIAFKDTTDAIKLDEATKQGEVIIDVWYYGQIDVHNEKATDDKDYSQYVVVDVNGDKYITGSNSFWTSFLNIVQEMEGEDEDYKVKAFRLPSKNREGKDFITCAIV